MKKLCVICGTEFDAKRKRKTCDDKCSRELTLERERMRPFNGQRARAKAKHRERYRTDSEYRERCRWWKRKRLLADPEYRALVRARERERSKKRCYQTPAGLEWLARKRKRQRDRWRDRYRTDPEFRARYQKRRSELYFSDPAFRDRQKSRSRKWHCRNRQSRRAWEAAIALSKFFTLLRTFNEQRCDGHRDHSNEPGRVAK